MQLSCKLTTPELQARKATVLTNLRSKVIERRDLPDGYSYKFAGNDSMLDELTEFIKTERLCCDFFSFNLLIEKDLITLHLTGPQNAKEFIEKELEL